MIVRLFEQRDYSFTDDTLLGIIHQDKTLIIFVREWGAFCKTGNDCIHRLRYLRFLTTMFRNMYKCIDHVQISVYRLRYNCVLFNMVNSALGVFGKGCSLLCTIVVKTCFVGSLEAYCNW
jgi:hypothetical protein